MKKAQQRRRAKKLLTGLIIEWSDPNALDDNQTIYDQRVSHTKPILRLKADEIWRDYSDWIIHHQVLLWQVDIDAVSIFPNGTEGHEKRRAIGRGHLYEVASECESVIKDAMLHGHKPKETLFRVECLGDRSATDEDFEDYEKYNSNAA